MSVIGGNVSTAGDSGASLPCLASATVPLDDDSWLLLHQVRVCGLVAAEETESVVVLVDAGLVARASRGLRITAEGRELHATWARVEVGSEIESRVGRAYERFLPLNRELLRLCSEWQVRPGGVPNDHRDVRYDWAVVDRVRTLDERIAPIVRSVAKELDRFAGYRPRLRAALARVDDGEHEWLTSPRVDSYHTVWMQLHEDLLLALGADRATEPAPEEP
jgi:hypothetical protein